jgi:STE24 endopeptidase
MTNDQSKISDLKSQTSPSPAGLSDAELAEAKRYGRHELACAVADKLIDAGYLAVAAFLLAKPIDAWLHDLPLLAGNWSLRLMALFLVITGLHIAVSFPLSFYSGHVLEHKFGLSAQGFGGWLWRYVKHNLLSLALSLGMVLGLYWLIWTARGAWWLAAAGAFFLVSIVLGQLAPVLILPLFYRIQRLDAPEIAARIRHLAESTGLSIEGVYRIDFSDETVKANAMLAGLGRTRRVLLGDTLINGFQPDEIEVVFAHEIGHHALHHIRKIMVLGLFYSAAGFWVCDRLLAAFVGPGGVLDYAQLPTHTLPLMMWLLTMFATLTEPLKNALSRRFERQADRYALERTGLREAYLSAFRKLARLNKDDPAPHWLDVLLFHGHPPVAERLKMAEER